MVQEVLLPVMVELLVRLSLAYFQIMAKGEDTLKMENKGEGLVMVSFILQFSLNKNRKL